MNSPAICDRIVSERMILAALFLIVTILGGAFWTYLYEEKCSFVTRLIEGAFVGQVVWGLIGFVLASFIGLTSTTVILSIFITIFLPLSYVLWRKKNIFTRDMMNGFSAFANAFRKPRRHIFHIAIYLLVTIALVLSLSKGAYIKSGGIYTRYIDNYSDFTLHAGIINGFVYGNNFPPEHPDYAGSRLTYPFLTDFIAAMLVVAGAPLVSAIFLQSLVYLIFFTGLIHLWVRQFTKSNFALITVISLIFLNGGLGWVLFFKEAFASGGDIVKYIFQLPHDYTSYGEKIRWTNSTIFWFIPMRAMLLGVPIVIIVVNLWWRALGKLSLVSSNISAKRMAGAGVIAALLPLVHGHSFFAIFVIAMAMAVLFRSHKLWGIFFVLLIIISLPQFAWLATDSEASIRYFLGFIWGWNQAERNIVLFWLVNTGLFIPLLLIAFWRRNILDPVARRFYLPFLIAFIIPNFIKLAPWEWDNIKVLAYWYIFSTIPVALLLAWLWKKRTTYKIIAIIFLFSLILAGILDNWRAWTNANELVIFDPSTLTVAEYIKRELPPRSVILTAPVQNNPVLMSGKQSYVGSFGRIWTHGILWVTREDEVRLIYSGGQAAEKLLVDRDINYVVVGNQEQEWADNDKVKLDVNFFSRYPLEAEIQDTKIYRITK